MMIFLGCPPSSSAAPSRLGQITDFITRRAPYWAQHSVFLNWSVFFTVLPLCYNTVLYLGKLFLDAVSALLYVYYFFLWRTRAQLFGCLDRSDQRGCIWCLDQWVFSQHVQQLSKLSLFFNCMYNVYVRHSYLCLHLYYICGAVGIVFIMLTNRGSWAKPVCLRWTIFGVAPVTIIITVRQLHKHGEDHDENDHD